MSINSITDRFGKKLNLYADNIDSEALLADSVSASTVSASSVDAGEITSQTVVTTPYVHSILNKSYSDVSDVTLDSSTPPGFATLISAISYSRSETEAYDDTLAEYVKIFTIKMRCQVNIGLAPANVPCSIDIRFGNIPAEYASTFLQSGRCDFNTAGGTKGNLGFYNLVNNTSGEMIATISSISHLGIFQGTANTIDLEFSTRKFF